MLPLDLIVFLLIAGALTGFLAGLLGLGGGLVVVPAVTLTLGLAHFAGGDIQHLALGTSFAVMMFTGLSSALAHHRKRAVRWDMVRHMAPAMIIGTLIGSAIAGWLPGEILRGFFVLFNYIVAVQIFRNVALFKMKAVPGRYGVGFAGAVIGMISSWLGIGGSAMSIPFMTQCKIPVKNAIATSSALSWPIAVAGCIGYIVHGWNKPDLPWGSFGYVYLPAMLSLTIMTIIFAPIGARLAHRLPASVLNKAFAVLLLIVGTQMLYELFFI